MDQVVVSESNRTPVVQIVTWFCIVVSVLAYLSHAGVKIYTSRSLSVETGLVFLSLVFGSVQSIAVSIEASNGLGKPSDTLDYGHIQAILKSEYAATILFFFSVAFSKFAIVAFIHGLTPRKLDRRFNYAIGAVSTLWLVASVFVAAFQCPPPRTWDKTSGRCLDYLTWWEVVAILNIVSDIALVALEVAILIPLQMSRPRKASLILLFTCRLLVSVAAVVQLYFLNKDINGPLKNDFALGYWRSIVCNQVVQCLAIITTSLPYTKLFMESFESGLIRVEEPRRWKTGTGDISTENSSGRCYELLDVSRSSQNRKSEGISKTQTFTVESAQRI